MIEPKGNSLQYLKDYRADRIPKGMKIGCAMDNFHQFKFGQSNIILGHDNVGKSYWAEWFFLVLSLKYNLKFLLWMDENKTGKVLRDLIQMYVGSPYMTLTNEVIETAMHKIEQNFSFLDNSISYKPDDIMKLAEVADVVFLDPYNGLDVAMDYNTSYKSMNTFRKWCNKNNKTNYLSCHPATASGRRGAAYPESHEWAGMTMPPLKSDIEGGKPFSNKADDFIIAHRLVNHKEMWKYTLLEIAKVKDTDTGGRPTYKDEPILFDYNHGLGFIVEGVDPLKGLRYYDDREGEGFKGFEAMLNEETPF